MCVDMRKCIRMHVCTLFGYFHFNSFVLLHRCVRSLRIEHLFDFISVLVVSRFLFRLSPSFVIVNSYYYIVLASRSCVRQLHQAISRVYIAMQCAQQVKLSFK